MTTATPPERVNLRSDTRVKWLTIATARRWAYTETADALADFYIEHNKDIELPAPALAPTSEASQGVGAA